MASTPRKPSAAKAEATEAVRTYEYDGATYSLDNDLDEIGLMEAYESGQIVTATKVLVGEDTFKSLREKGKLRKLADLNGLVEAAFKAMGTTEGES